MTSLVKENFDTPEDIFNEIEKALNENDIEVYSKIDHDYHFIIEIGSDEKKIGRLKIYYNKFYQCTSVYIIDPIKPSYFNILSQLLPIKKKNVIQEDQYISYLQNNYHAKVVCLYETNDYVCYSISMKNEDVWVKIIKNEKLECQFLMGDFDLFDQVQCVFEDEMSAYLNLALAE
ncbi:hypothetical protein [Aquibacillus sediminis]|uniref:hypothetical protein n=1 Tax=Aquibacillus sediminis TaxID=2574734 RepID=UPI001109F2C1|nr:hypothetical protein [Aquibacillus sediminis]